MSVKLRLEEEEATLIWCRGARAQKGFKEAVLRGDKAAMVFYGSWMAAVQTQIADAAPEALRPSGNETDKP